MRSHTRTGCPLVVHVGRGDGRLTAALRLSDAYMVQGLDSDAGHIEAGSRSDYAGLNLDLFPTFLELATALLAHIQRGGATPWQNLARR
jgi:predicted RNA methylase